jgi:hypothetical protein
MKIFTFFSNGENSGDIIPKHETTLNDSYNEIHSLKLLERIEKNKILSQLQENVKKYVIFPIIHQDM